MPAKYIQVGAADAHPPVRVHAGLRTTRRNGQLRRVLPRKRVLLLQPRTAARLTLPLHTATRLEEDAPMRTMTIQWGFE